MKRVLIVDDSMVASRQLAELVRNLEGFDLVGRAANGAEALTLCGELAPDIIFMDMVMPIMDGLQALRSIMSTTVGVRVIMVSSLGNVGARVAEAIRLGADCVVAKPFDASQVREALCSAAAA
jgi:two-component system chemotaxis response regulator CheY